tara:strand:+ start:249 stop:530 length:282 start_codon:yes stop_codon:yes gene_type:complete
MTTSTLTVAHLPLLKAKLVVLKLEQAQTSETIFDKHYTHEGGLDKVAYQEEYAGLDSKRELNYIARQHLEVAIAECEKLISINNALELIKEVL